MGKVTHVNSETQTPPAAEGLQQYAETVQVLADELKQIEAESTADEITYRIRDGDVAVIELAYHLG